MTAILKGSIVSYMAKQTVQAWLGAILREFIKAGSTAAHGTLGAMLVLPEHVNLQHPWVLLQVASTVFGVKGGLAVLDYLSKDPIPLDEETPA